MRKSWTSSIAAILLSSCAARLAGPASQPASAPVGVFDEFTAVPAEWCAPIDGVFLSWTGVDQELLMRRKEHVACEMRVITAEERADIADARAKAAELAAEQERSWFRLVGVPVLVGVAAAALGGFVGYELRK